jgi:fructoselysine 6-kinase
MFIKVKKIMIYPGGNAVNVAVHAKRQGLNTCYFGFFGHDSHGNLLKEKIATEGVHQGYCITMHGNSGTTKIGLRDGDRYFIGDDFGVQYKFSIPDFLLEILEKSKINFYSGFTSYLNKTTQRLDFMDKKNPKILEKIKKHSRIVAFDFSNIKEIEEISRLSSYIDIAFMSLGSQNQSYAGVFLEKIKKYFHENSVIVLLFGKNGSAGFYHEKIYFQEPIEAKRIDSLGCGDAYIGAFLAEHIKTNGNIKKCLKKGTVAATENLANIGAW